jgi:hypothetical protein
MQRCRCSRSFSVQAEPLRSVLFAVDGADKGASFGSEDRLGAFGVAEFAPSVSVTARFDDAARGVDGIEAMFGVRGERTAERPKLHSNDVSGLVSLVLEDRNLAVSVELDVAARAGREVRRPAA